MVSPEQQYIPYGAVDHVGRGQVRAHLVGSMPLHPLATPSRGLAQRLRPSLGFLERLPSAPRRPVFDESFAWGGGALAAMGLAARSGAGQVAPTTLLRMEEVEPRPEQRLRAAPPPGLLGLRQSLARVP